MKALWEAGRTTCPAVGGTTAKAKYYSDTDSAPVPWGKGEK